jgi:hypothetical protein
MEQNIRVEQSDVLCEWMRLNKGEEKEECRWTVDERVAGHVYGHGSGGGEARHRCSFL